MTGAVIYTINSGWVPPVDYVLEVYGDTSPAAMYDGTVWMPLRDCIIMAAGDIFAAGTTGGSTTVTLTTAEMPNHAHAGSTSSTGAHTHIAKVGRNKSGYPGSMTIGTGGYSCQWYTTTTSSAGAHTHMVTVGSTGGGKAWSLMNPYEAVNFWQRVG